MPGGGEVIPNGSIHWNRWYTGKPKDWTGVQGKKPRAKQDVSQENRVLYGVEPSAEGTHPLLHVTLRFENEQQATDALQKAVVTRHGPSGMSEIHFDIKAVPRNEDDAEAAPPNRFAQIRYEW
jgi:hypothetical protein